MPSPFPGMDPYLENPTHWSDVHHGLISEIQARLNQQLRPKYFARVEERVYISDEYDVGRSVIIPDVRLMTDDSESWRHVTSPTRTSGTATIEPIEITTLIDDEIHEARLEIIDVEHRSVVTVIEILSPTNKVQGSRGQESYADKRRDTLHSPSHLVEIDLLRAGVRIYVREQLPAHDYLVYISRAKGLVRRRATVWAIPITKPLPAIPIPLRGDDPDALLDLQQVLNTAYERGAYDVDIDYTRDPVPPLTAEQAEWARQTIATARHA